MSKLHKLLFGPVKDKYIQSTDMPFWVLDKGIITRGAHVSMEQEVLLNKISHDK